MDKQQRSGRRLEPDYRHCSCLSSWRSSGGGTKRPGMLPTEADVRAHLVSDAAGVIARGEAFLRERAPQGARIETDVHGNVMGGD
jgi:hypothetical protein